MERNKEKAYDYSDYYGSIDLSGETNMSQVQVETRALISAIEKDEVYIRYQKAKQEISKYPPLKNRTDEFREKNYNLQNCKDSIYKEADHLQEEYKDIIDNPISWEYLIAENGFCRMLQQVQWQLLEGLDFELSFPQDGEAG